jgi:hypothetical protein
LTLFHSFHFLSLQFSTSHYTFFINLIESFFFINLIILTHQHNTLFTFLHFLLHTFYIYDINNISPFYNPFYHYHIHHLFHFHRFFIIIIFRIYSLFIKKGR